MRSRIPFIQQRLRTVTNAPNGPGTPIELSWTSYDAGSTVDTVTQSVMGTGKRSSQRMRALVHFIQIGSSGVKVFNEIELGDVIVDLPGDVELEGKIDLQVTIAGETYVPKMASDKLAKSWDAVAGGVRLTRPLLLRKAT